MFNYNHLYYFYVVGTSSSLTEAAHKLKISQPSLSAQIKTLEAKLDTPLFARVGRKLELTSEGKTALTYCRRFFEIAEELSRALELNTSPYGERIHVGVSEEVERPFAADIVTSIINLDRQTNEKRFSIRMVSNDHYVLLEQLQKRELDLALTNQFPLGKELAVLTDIQMPVTALCSPRLYGKLFAKGRKSQRGLKDLLESTDTGLILPTPGLRLRAEAESFLEKTRIQSWVVFESNVMASLVRAVVDGVGIGLLPRPYVGREFKQHHLIEINPQPLWQHNLYLVALEHRVHEENIQKLASTLRKMCLELECKVSK